MWLLDTHTLKLHYFDSPEAVEEGYMILSHVWDESEELETSFQDIQRIHERCAASGEDPHVLVNTKIRKCCELGKRHGYKWAWIDTCCIDKTSSAELMEAINAMYRFYALSLVCYVYIPDAYDRSPDQVRYNMRNPRDPELLPLIKTKWQERGWTLQELIAPRIVHFLSMDWEFMGTKNDLADDLELGLGIPAPVLRHEQSPLEFSVAQRMSWAARRETTRVEDEAYSLLGLFGINMPTLYGEGRKAFQRLQEEILKQTGDTTLFAWGLSAPLENLRDYPAPAQTGLLADAPADFKYCRGIHTVPSRGSSNSVHRRINFRTTPHGFILARIPVLHIDGQAYADLSWYQGSSHLVLMLRKRACASHLPFPTYDVGLYDASITPLALAPSLRIIKLQPFHGSLASESCVNYRTSMRKILLLRHHSRIQHADPIHLPMNHAFPPSICITEHVIRTLLGYPTVEEVSVTNAHFPWSGDPPLMIAFREQGLCRSDALYPVIQFGRCTSHTTNGEEAGSIWATVQGSPSRWECTEGNHQCPEDHILHWPDLQKCFVFRYQAIDKGMGDHMAKWSLHISFAISATTGALVLTKLDLDYRVLPGYSRMLKPEEWRGI